ncbi:fatty acid--CoA ligase [Elysia marginata]|uniref:Fatty acid--CoA ligase n=1 Tax=Elysia marginata TaxID=1093978 RepID=A0AAV4GXQ1_9GAST|nr:fatty acid--CoA ligase [Elysia marginata]
MSDNIFIVLKDVVKNHPDREAMVSYNIDLNRQALTFKQFWTLSARCAAWLRGVGMKRHDNVLVTVPMSLEYFVICFGIMMAGGAVVPMKKLSAHGKAVAETVRLCETAFVFLKADGEDSTYDLLRPDIKIEKQAGIQIGSVTRSDMPQLTTAILVQRETSGSVKGFLDFLGSLSEEYVDMGLRPTDASCFVLTMDVKKLWCYKHCEVSHRELLSLKEFWAKKFPNFDSFYFAYPWYGAIGVPYDTLCGGTRIMPDLWDTEDLNSTQVKIVAANKVKNAMMPPHDVMQAQEALKDKQGPFLDTIIIGGGMLVSESVEPFKKFAKNVIISYMNSEAVYVTMLQLEKDKKFENYDAGFPIDGVELMVLDKHHQPVRTGQVGEIAIKSKTMFTRYYGDPEMTRKVWAKDGWYLTSDAGYLRPDGRLFVFGRQGDVISRGVIIFTPAMIEKPISNHPDVLEVRVVPIPDPVNGQNSCACVVKRAESGLNPNDIKDLAEGSMSEFGKYLFTLDHVLIFENSIAKKSKEELISIACSQLGVVPPKF